MKDLVISAVANYTPDKIKVYVESLNKSNFDGDKIMVCYNLPNDTINYLSEKGWQCYGADLQGHPHMKRLIDVWAVLQESNKEWRYVITTDVRDVVWQTNPSDWLIKNLNKNILCSSECIAYENQPWGYKNVHEGYGPIFWNWVSPKTICNVGVIAGKYESIKDLLMLNWLVSQAGDTRHFTDQSSFNFIIHNSLLKGSLYIDSNFALQVGTNTKEIVAKNGFIMNEADEPYVIVHQYDRDERLNNFVLNEYR